MLNFFRRLFRMFRGENRPGPQTHPAPVPTAPPTEEPGSTPQAHIQEDALSTGQTAVEQAAAPGVLVFELQRYSAGRHDTIGKLSHRGELLAYTIENPLTGDLPGEALAIPAGDYPVRLRSEGGRHATYAFRFGDFHKGLLWICDVPSFEFPVIQLGNDALHAYGSITVGTQVQREQQIDQRRELWYSEQAYRKVYGAMVAHILAGREVRLHIRD
ncbi:MAG: hypothetical protein OHK0039_05650 [Bacteroidia bacterium]